MKLDNLFLVEVRRGLEKENGEVSIYFLMLDADYEFILSGGDDGSAKPFIVFEIDV